MKSDKLLKAFEDLDEIFSQYQQFQKLGAAEVDGELSKPKNFDSVITPREWGEVINHVSGARVAPDILESLVGLNVGIYYAEAGVVFGNHLHKENEETVIILTGEVLERNTMQKLKANDSFIFKKGEPHQFEIIKNSLWLVVWRPPITMVE